MKSAVTNLVGALIWGAILFMSGYGVGKHSAQKAEVVAVDVPVVSEAAQKDDVKEINGVVWYSQRTKSWRFMRAEGFDMAPHDLTKIELLRKLIISHRKLQGESERPTGDDCSYSVGLQVRRLEMKGEPAPGYSAAYEVLKVHYVRADDCYHCEHATKAKRE